MANATDPVGRKIARGSICLIANETHKFRRACEGDAAALVAIDAQKNYSPWSEKQFEQACVAPTPVEHSLITLPATAWVLELAGCIQGFFVYSQVLDEATLHAITVHEDFHGRGLGRALLRGALGKMKYAGVTRCLLEVRRSNVIAQQLYHSEGFTLDGERANYYKAENGTEDALLMSLKL